MGWVNSTTATLKVKDRTSNEMFTIHGVTSNMTGNYTPENFVAAANLLLGIGHLEAVEDENTKLALEANNDA